MKKNKCNLTLIYMSSFCCIAMGTYYPPYCVYFILFIPFYFLGHPCGMQKFLGQGSNLCHRSSRGGSADYKPN